MTDFPQLTLGRIVLLVRDYDEALAFYMNAFGAHVLFDSTAPTGDRYLHLGFGRPEGSSPENPHIAGIGIWLLTSRNGADSRVGRQTEGQPVAVFYTSDVEAATARVAKAGGEIIKPVIQDNGSRYSHVNDLYGNEFILVELTS